MIKKTKQQQEEREKALCRRLFLLMLLAHVAALLLVIYFLAARKDNGATALPYAGQLCPSVCVEECECSTVCVASGATSSNSRKKIQKKRKTRSEAHFRME